MSGRRQAAVALHALAPADRDAILGELSATDQATLRAHLAELRELGFEPLMVNSGAFDRAPRPHQEPDAAQRIAAANVQAVARVLDAEPMSLVVQILQLQTWPWADAYVAQLTAARRHLLQGTMTHTPPVAVARQTFLLDALADALARQAPEQRISTASPSWIAKVWAWTQ